MSNFAFLLNRKEYGLFAAAAVEAEKVYAAAPAMCAIGCRKALELAVKWVYAADRTIEKPYRDNLSSLVYDEGFRQAVDESTWKKLPYIIKLGNNAVHTERSVQQGDVLLALRSLFEFIQWVDYCYGTEYEERKFSLEAIPTEKVVVDTKKIKAQESLLQEQQAEIDRLRRQVEQLSAQYTADKQTHKQERSFTADDISEFETRKRYIDLDLKLMGWQLAGNHMDVLQEYEVTDMMGIAGQLGYVDYLLFGRDGLPLAVVEAKRTSKDPNKGRKQAMLYAECLERKFGRKPMVFTTNGFETFFWDDKTGPQRQVSGIFSKADLQKLMNRREERKQLNEIKIDEKIAGRPYQMEAIRAVCDRVMKGFRKNLLVMATGTGKTRTASALTDVLSRGGYVTNVLFLADRKALVKQAKEAFKEYLPDLSLCNLVSNKEDKNARIVFSTYPTMLNAIDNTKTEDGIPLFTPAHFDLIIIDESHRSIFKKYKVIFDYFDAVLVGLTATPKTDVDRNTYEFFELEENVPTYAYDYDTAVNEKYLVPYYNIEIKTKYLQQGINYDDLTPEEKAAYEDAFAEDDSMPDFIPPEEMNRYIFNQNTVDLVLQNLMERGIKVAGGDCLGKTIIFAQNKKHAEFIVQRFNKLYPYLAQGHFAQRVICEDDYAQTIIDDFKQQDKEPHIAVSVDMMDTGIDVPECVNLVFFKVVRSKTKFWQMIGRGTRLCGGLSCVDDITGEYTDKKYFLIFDYCSNFEFFREHQKGFEAKETKTLSEAIFGKKVHLIVNLQQAAYVEDDVQAFRQQLVNDCQQQVAALNQELVAVRQKLRYVEQYKKPEIYQFINEEQKMELIEHLAPLIVSKDKDEAAKRFDSLMYSLMLAQMENDSRVRQYQRKLCSAAQQLQKKVTIPQVKQSLSLLKAVQEDDFLNSNDILALEQVRIELRELMKFLDPVERRTVEINLKDDIIGIAEGEPLPPTEEFEDYKKKVNRYVLEHGDDLAIYKLTHNLPLTQADYQELERILTEELGTKEDYAQEYKDTPFGLMIRKIAKVDHGAAMEAFAQFINDQSLNQQQIAFVEKVIAHVEQNGYMEDLRVLMQAPFNSPIAFNKLFDKQKQLQLMQAIKQVTDNAVHVVA